MKKGSVLKLNNKGSGLVTVMVAVLFLMILGSLLLMYSLTNFEMKTADRKGKQNSYDAETVMAEISTGFQNMASDSVDECLKKTLIDFGGKSEVKVQAEFADLYKDKLLEWYVDGKVPIKDPVKAMIGLDHGYYNIAAIAAMVKDCHDYGTVIFNTYGDEDKYLSGSYTVMNNKYDDFGSTYFYQIHYSPDFEEPIFELSYTEEDLDDNGTIDFRSLNKALFKNISVTFVNEDRTTTLTTDISITVPDVGYSVSAVSATEIKKYCLVVGEKLIHNNSNTVSVTGNAYLGSIEASMAGKLEFVDAGSESLCVVRDSIEVSGAGTSDTQDRLYVGNNTVLYAGDIEIQDAARVSLLYKTYVADDLDLRGYNAKAVLEGSYYGFGSSVTDSNNSSAILVNGLNSKLDIQNLSSLTLSGFSFVDTALLNDSDVIMGESVSVKENQRVYLIDEKYLKYSEEGKLYESTLQSNPMIYPKDAQIIDVEHNNLHLDTSVSWRGEEGLCTYTDYGASVTPATINYNNSQKITYYFLTFSDTAKRTAEQNANQYFKDYYSNNYEEIENYANKYLETTDFIGTSHVSGNWFLNYPTSKDLTVKSYELKKYLSPTTRESIIESAATVRKTFKNLYLYLSNSKPDQNEINKRNNFTDDSTGYDWCINWNKIHEKFEGSSTTPVVKYYYKKDSNKAEGSLYALVIDCMDIDEKDSVVTVTNGTYELNADTLSSDEYENVAIIVCNGNLKITGNGSFDGIIFCKGNLTVENEFSFINNNNTTTRIARAFDGYLNGSSDFNDMISNLFYIVLASKIDADDDGQSGSGADVVNLVKYERWEKG